MILRKRKVMMMRRAVSRNRMMISLKDGDDRERENRTLSKASRMRKSEGLSRALRSLVLP